jgi:glycosyltransferase involved in cell wall biosynthesis
MQTIVTGERMRLFCRYADLVLHADSSIVRMLPRCDFFFKYFPIDTDSLEAATGSRSARDVPTIIHAPNHRNVKGTEFLVEAVADLRARGFPCELVLVERVSRIEAQRLYRHADIIADQFVIGAFGMFALEGLSLGKPVLAYLDDTNLGDPVFNLPIVNTNSENITAVLAVLLKVSELRRRLGISGRAAVERYQSIPALAEVWDQLFRHVWSGHRLELEFTRHFSPERHARPFTTDPSQPAFWPVFAEDLREEIRAALDLLRDGAVSSSV